MIFLFLMHVILKIFVIDPLHCLLLNICKSAWKYSFGDRMTPDQRTRVATYLLEIGLPLDIRELGKRNPQQKWFGGAQFDEFVLGVAHNAKSKSPGLVRNILAILELVFDEPTVVAAAAEAEEAEASAAAAAAAAAQPIKKAKSRKERMSSGPVGGFGASEVQTQHQTTQAVESLLDLGELEGVEDYSSQSPAIIAYVRQRYGNHAKTVLEIIALWESYGRVYHAWRDSWTSDTDDYLAARAMQFARAARDFAKFLAMVSKYKHKSW